MTVVKSKPIVFLSLSTVALSLSQMFVNYLLASAASSTTQDSTHLSDDLITDAMQTAHFSTWICVKTQYKEVEYWKYRVQLSVTWFVTCTQKILARHRYQWVSAWRLTTTFRFDRHNSAVTEACSYGILETCYHNVSDGTARQIGCEPNSTTATHCRTVLQLQLSTNCSERKISSQLAGLETQSQGQSHAMTNVRMVRWQYF